MDDEEATIYLAATGDPEAFSRLFNAYYDMTRAFVYRLCLDATEASDLAQETFIKAARGLSAYKGESSFKSWLFRIAANSVRDWQRSNARRWRMQEALASEQSTEDQTRVAESVPVKEALLGLPTELREAVALVYYEEMSHAEAGRLLGCAETTVSWRIFRARGKLKKMLEARKQ